MGWLATLGSESRAISDWLTRDDDDLGTLTPAGVRVTTRAALGLTTVWRCVDLLTSAVAQAPKDVVLKLGGRSFPEYSPPAWLDSPNPADPTYTANDYFGQVALSLLFDGNYFVAVMPHVLDPQALIVLDPTRVEVQPGPRYVIRDEYGKVIRNIGPMQMLHGTWIRPAQSLRGISPLETLRRGIGAALAAEDFGARFFGQGAALSFGVEVPHPLTPELKETLRDSLKRRHQGLGNSHAIGVLTSGAKFVTGLAPTPEQAQMLATRKFSVEDLCRPYGVPPAMAGSTEPGAASFASTDNYDKWFQQRAVLPLTARIEAQHNRLLRVPESVTDPSASMQFKINLDWIVRGSLLERYQAYEAGVRGGVIKPREARIKEDLAPLADGSDDQLFMQSQMTPINRLGLDQAAPAVPAGGAA